MTEAEVSEILGRPAAERIIAIFGTVCLWLGFVVTLILQLRESGPAGTVGWFTLAVSFVASVFAQIFILVLPSLVLLFVDIGKSVRLARR